MLNITGKIERIKIKGKKQDSDTGMGKFLKYIL